MDRWERRDKKLKAIKRRMPKHGASVRVLNRLGLQKGGAK